MKPSAKFRQRVIYVVLNTQPNVNKSMVAVEIYINIALVLMLIVTNAVQG